MSDVNELRRTGCQRSNGESKMTKATRGPGQTQSATADLGFDADALRKKYLEERDKRLRPDGIDQYIQPDGEFAHFVDDPYVEPGYTREPLTDEVDVLLIGGGFGGLMAGARLREPGAEEGEAGLRGARGDALARRVPEHGPCDDID